MSDLCPAKRPDSFPPVIPTYSALCLVHSAAYMMLLSDAVPPGIVLLRPDLMLVMVVWPDIALSNWLLWEWDCGVWLDKGLVGLWFARISLSDRFLARLYAIIGGSGNVSLNSSDLAALAYCSCRIFASGANLWCHVTTSGMRPGEEVGVCDFCCLFSRLARLYWETSLAALIRSSRL